MGNIHQIATLSISTHVIPFALWVMSIKTIWPDTLNGK